MIKLYEPKFGKEELKAILPVLKSGILTQGPRVAKLEKRFARYVGGKYAVAVNSCTSALFLSLQYEKKFHGVKKVTIPSVTFVSVANMIVNSGLKLEFTDNISVGDPYWLEGTRIIDSAHDIQRGCYSPDSLMCFSFYPTKMIGSCEGGMIATNDKEAYDWLRKARNNGMERKSMFDWDYIIGFPGWKMVMNDIQAAIALIRLKKLDLFNRQRRKIRDYYNRNLYPDNNLSLHLYTIIIQNRNKFIEDMAKVGIQCSLHFKPIHLQPAFRKKSWLLPMSEYWGNHSVSIPLHENLTLSDAKYIVRKIKEWKSR